MKYSFYYLFGALDNRNDFFSIQKKKSIVNLKLKIFFVHLFFCFFFFIYKVLRMYFGPDKTADFCKKISID